eukprot:3465581-Alexandrium_andersonii.AAC.1
MARAADEEMFRRYCGMMGRDPNLPKGQQSKAGSLAPWNWRNFDDRPLPRVEGRTLGEGNAERN